MQQSTNSGLTRGRSLVGLMVAGAVLALSDKAVAQYFYSPWGPSLTVTMPEPADPAQTELFSITLLGNARWVNPVEIRVREQPSGASDRIFFVNDTNNVGQIYFASANESGQLPDVSYPFAPPVVAIDEANPFTWPLLQATDGTMTTSVSATIISNDTIGDQITLVPEPAIGGLMGLGAVLLGVCRPRCRQPGTI